MEPIISDQEQDRIVDLWDTNRGYASTPQLRSVATSNINGYSEPENETNIYVPMEPADNTITELSANDSRNGKSHGLYLPRKSVDLKAEFDPIIRIRSARVFFTRRMLFGVVGMALFITALFGLYISPSDILDFTISFGDGYFPSFSRMHHLPSINLFDYNTALSFPVMDEFPQGIPRQNMPQFEGEIPPGDPDTWERGTFWYAFHYNITNVNGYCTRETVNMLDTQPLQSELSGHIVYNRLFGDSGKIMKALLNRNPKVLEEHVVLIRLHEPLKVFNGTILEPGTLVVLDGHHTIEAVRLCHQHTYLKKLRGGNAKSVCGKNFNHIQENILVLNQVIPLEAIKTAIYHGSATGYGMTL